MAEGSKPNQPTETKAERRWRMTLSDTLSQRQEVEAQIERLQLKLTSLNHTIRLLEDEGP